MKTWPSRPLSEELPGDTGLDCVNAGSYGTRLGPACAPWGIPDRTGTIRLLPSVDVIIDPSKGGACGSRSRPEAESRDFDKTPHIDDATMDYSRIRPFTIGCWRPLVESSLRNFASRSQR